jgi:hypothetical protein
MLWWVQRLDVVGRAQQTDTGRQVGGGSNVDL